ncbi:MAG TPA: hypothetical protein VNH40_07205 [Gaiellaceae bacterium]|nr:hypothetical protein [Gaiellaceae bacterium]
MSTRPYDLRPRIVNGLLLPVLFALAIAAAVIAGDDSDSFWVGLLAFLVAWKSGRVVRRLVRGLLVDAVHAAIWPGGATAYAFLFVWAGLPKWLGVLLAMLAAEATKIAVSPLLPERRKLAERWAWFEEWGIPALGDAIEGRWRRKEEPPD